MSSSVLPVRPASRRAVTAERLAGAAVEELRKYGYDLLTVRNVARRAGVAPATAYIHFTSKDHLVAEAFWRMLERLPEVRAERKRKPASRVASVISDVVQLVVMEPALAAAATTAMLANEPSVARVRRRVGQVFRDRFAAALGDQADDAALDALDLAFSGALVRAGVGEIEYADLTDLMHRVAEAVTVSAPAPAAAARAAKGG